MSQVVIAGQVMRVEQTPTRTGGMRYKVSYSDGNDWTTFDMALAERAFSMIGQPSTLEGEIKRVNRQGRTFTNYDLVSLAAGVNQVPQSGTSAVGAGNSSSTIPTGGSGQEATASTLIPQAGSEEAERICRGNAVNALGALYSGSGIPVEEFLADAALVAAFIQKGVLPPSYPQPGQVQLDPAATVEDDLGPEY